MKNAKTGKRVLATIVAAGILTLGVSAFAAEALTTALTPAETVAKVTSEPLETIQAERATGKTYGTIAKDAGKLDEFKALSLASKKEILDQQVKAGTITQERANEIYKALEKAQATCDGTGSAQIGRKAGIGFGSGSGMKDGTGASTGFGRSGNRAGNGMGRGMGRGMGMGVQR